MTDFQPTFERLQVALEEMGESERAGYTTIRVENEGLQELLAAAQELAEPEPAFFTRG